MSIAPWQAPPQPTTRVGPPFRSWGPLRRRLIVPVAAVGALLVIAAGLWGRRLVMSASGVPDAGPTAGLEPHGFHAAATMKGGELVMPIQLIDGTSLELILPRGSNTRHFNFDPQAPALVRAPGGVTLTAWVFQRSVIDLGRPTSTVRQVLKAPGRTVSLYRQQPTGDLPGQGWTESLVFLAGSWDVFLPVGAQGKPEPSQADLQTIVDHLGPHQTRAGFPVLDVSAPLVLESTPVAPPSARLTDWTVVPGTSGAAAVPDLVLIGVGPCDASGTPNPHGLLVSPPRFPPWLGTVSGRPSEFVLCSKAFPVHLDVMGTASFTQAMAAGLGVEAFTAR